MKNLTKITQEQLEAIKILGEYQEGKAVYIYGNISSLVGFESEEHGTLIINPFLDECGWGNVNPIEYYGNEFLNSDFLKIDFNDIEKYKNTEIIAVCNGEKEFEGSSYDFLDINEYLEELEELVFEAINNKIATKMFPSGKWTVYTK